MLTYGTIIANDWNRNRVREFNENNDTCYIQLRDYSEGLGKRSPETDRLAQQRATTEILAGNIPDIMDDTLPLALYGEKGLLADLWPYIDADPDLGRDQLMTHVLDCASVEGKLCYLFKSFYLETAVTCAPQLKGKTSVTLKELLDVYDGMPEGSAVLGYNASPQNTLLYLAAQDQFVDRAAGTCRFDSEEFISLLELCGRIRHDDGGYEDDGGAALREGRQLLATAAITSLYDFQRMETLCGGPESLWDYEGYLAENDQDAYLAYLQELRYDPAKEVADGWVSGAATEGEYAAWVGYPTVSGSGSVFVPEYSLAISAACRYPEEAWSFVRAPLLPQLEGLSDGEVQMETHTFPVNKADFDRYLAAFMTREWLTDEEGNQLLDQNGQPMEKLISFMSYGRPESMSAYMPAASQTQRD